MNQSIELKLTQIRTDGGTQPRAQLNYNTVTEYAESIEDGATFPPIEVMYDGSEYWLWDGFHRVESHKKAGCITIRANVKQGTRRDAVLASVGANNDHGLRRTNDDKRRSVMTLLSDAEWVKWSDREIARQCGVTHPFVSGIRQNLSGNNYQMPQDRVVNRNGTTYAQNTANIGKAVTPPVGGVKLQSKPADVVVQPRSFVAPVGQPISEVVRTETRYVPAMPISIDEEFDEEPEESAFVWADDDSEPEEKPVIELQPKPQPKPQGSFKNVITVSEWQQMADPERKNVFDSAPQNTKYGWNETNDNIEWASWSWNPLTGCLHNCAYCYARDIANHYFTHLDHTGDRFTPVFYPDRLYSPSNAKSPNLDAITDPIERMAKRNVFVCSMADLFGKWVPTEWINAVLQQAWDNPQWTFLFLTKFPIRMAEFEYPSNTWIGTTVDSQHAVERAEKAFQKVRDGGYEGVAWLSCEPMMERLTFSKINLFDWVVVGGSSKSTQTAEFKPPIEWTFHLWEQAKNHGLPFYMKTNLGVENESRHREYPVGKQGENNG